MVTCLVWAGVLVVVVLLILVVGWAMVIAALPFWPPLAVAFFTMYFLRKLRVPRRIILAIAGVSTLALAVDLPFGLANYSQAMRDIGYSGDFGGALGFNMADLPHLLWLSLPFCLLTGIAAGSALAATRRQRSRPRPKRNPSRSVESDRSASLAARTRRGSPD